MKHRVSGVLLVATIMLVGLGTNVATAQEYQVDRTVLPIQPPPRVVITELDARDATKPERFEIKAPEGAPNVVIVLIDDIGFGATEPFGGAIETPTFDRLADGGRHGLRRDGADLEDAAVLLNHSGYDGRGGTIHV